MIIIQSTPANSQPFDFFDDKVQLENHHYKKIFGKPYQDSRYVPWKRGIVKISKRGESIRRIFYSGNNDGIKTDSLGLSIVSMQILDVQKNTEDDLKLNKGSRFLFMWQHPNHLTRIGFKYTVVLGLLSLLIAILPYLLKII